MRRLMTVEDYWDDVAAGGPIFRSYRAGFVAKLKLAGVHGDGLSMSVDALERARTAPGSPEHWKLIEAAMRHHKEGSDA